MLQGVDYWALGILIYEMLVGQSPFADADGNQVAICKAIVNAKLTFPRRLRDAAARDVVKKLLTKDPSARAGCMRAGSADIKDHAWFKGLDWEKMMAKTLKAPW